MGSPRNSPAITWARGPQAAAGAARGPLSGYRTRARKGTRRQGLPRWRPPSTPGVRAATCVENKAHEGFFGQSGATSTRRAGFSSARGYPGRHLGAASLGQSASWATLGRPYRPRLRHRQSRGVALRPPLIRTDRLAPLAQPGAHATAQYPPVGVVAGQAPWV